MLSVAPQTFPERRLKLYGFHGCYDVKEMSQKWVMFFFFRSPNLVLICLNMRPDLGRLNQEHIPFKYSTWSLRRYRPQRCSELLDPMGGFGLVVIDGLQNAMSSRAIRGWHLWQFRTSRNGADWGSEMGFICKIFSCSCCFTVLPS